MHLVAAGTHGIPKKALTWRVYAIAIFWLMDDMNLYDKDWGERLVCQARALFTRPLSISHEYQRS